MLTWFSGIMGRLWIAFVYGLASCLDRDTVSSDLNSKNLLAIGSINPRGVDSTLLELFFELS